MRTRRKRSAGYCRSMAGWRFSTSSIVPTSGSLRPFVRNKAAVILPRADQGGLRMKALVKSRREPGLWLEDVPMPEFGINDVLIRVLKTGICGTDVHIYKWDEWAQNTIPVPMAVGHEFV